MDSFLPTFLKKYKNKFKKLQDQSTMKKILILFILALPITAISSNIAKVVVQVIAGAPDLGLKQKIEVNTSQLLTRLNEAYDKGFENPYLDDRIITQSGMEKIIDLWKDSHFYCSSNNISENLLQKNNVFEIRNIPFVFGNTDKFDIVIEYLTDGRIDDFYIGLEVHQYKTVLEATSVIDQTRREIILNFLENFRTAYVKKDIDYIEKLYSDKALIITGKVLKPQDLPTDHLQYNLTKYQIEYQVSTKTEYINRLRNVFKGISYLRLEFKNIEVVKHRKNPNFYGIILQQTWDTQNYNDDGYLLLLVQFKDNEDPIIWVRTWQDAKDTPTNEKFGLHNFKITSGEKVN